MAESKESVQKSLKGYMEKRDFALTTEPSGNQKADDANRTLKIFVIQEHHARKLHYDFRLERDGVLKSWAIPKGFPETPIEKRLAVETEDHPIAYADFEGEIPAGQYGAGKVIIWDKGTYLEKFWNEKMIEFTLSGKRLQGRYVMVPNKNLGEKNWLLLKPKE